MITSVAVQKSADRCSLYLPYSPSPTSSHSIGLFGTRVSPCTILVSVCPVSYGGNPGGNSRVAMTVPNWLRQKGRCWHEPEKD